MTGMSGTRKIKSTLRTTSKQKSGKDLTGKSSNGLFSVTKITKTGLMISGANGN